MLTLLAALPSLLATTLVVCAPGYPGSASEAKPAMDTFAKSLATVAKVPAGSLSAAYEETDAGGVRALEKSDAGLVLATLPFFLQHEAELHLTARLMAVPKDGPALQKWTLVSGKSAALPLAGYAIQSSAGEAKFVRAAAPGVAPDVAVTLSGSVLSGLRKAASGEKLALLLDGPQAQSLGKLPFAAQLASLETSPGVPVAVIATVGKRLDEKQAKALLEGLQKVNSGPGGLEALDGIQMSGFVPLDEAALGAARAAWQKAP